MRIGVYLDGFNLYYGGRSLCGRGTAGWRWLDIRALAESIISERKNWLGAAIEHVTYCTARIDAGNNPSGHADQDIYLRALDATGTADHIHYGRYVTRLEYRPLATRGPRNRPLLATPSLPTQVRDNLGILTGNGRLMVPIAHTEEKGSDVNVASRLLLDVLQRTIDAAVVITNDSDLEFPIKATRQFVPVGTVNPSSSEIAGSLRGTAIDGAGRHFWRQLKPEDFTRHQLPNPAAGYSKPTGW